MKSSPPQARAAADPIAQHRSRWFKLPAPVAQRLQALLGLHPQPSRQAIVAELLRLGMDEFERNSRLRPGAAGVHADTTQPVYLPSEAFAEFRRLNYRHHLAMEYRLAKEDPGLQNPQGANTLGQVD